jgi:SpoVK/Ycf46/Vps4 family AAA+-type ATPase
MPIRKNDLPKDVVQLARIALAGRPQDVQLLIHRLSKQYRESYPEMTGALIALLQESPSRSSPLRKQADIPLPVDVDSRFQLLRVENTQLEHEPVLSKHIEEGLSQIISERHNPHLLMDAGLHPTKSVLFTGPPGVGKTMAAKWIAARLKRPLLVLDLTAVMSSFLGKTGNNVRYVLDYAKSFECVLLIDEFDAIAKRRDDTGEIGELKRLVTVLLQEIDDWPATGLLLAATNHPALLDPAIWRRFELVLEFGMPDISQIHDFVNTLLLAYTKQPELWSSILSYVFKGRSFSDIERQILLARRNSVISSLPLEENFNAMLDTHSALSREDRIKLAKVLMDSNIVSQRRVHELTGVSRDTIRKHSTAKKAK